jgi:tRNA(Ile)-lysidine synthase
LKGSSRTKKTRKPEQEGALSLESSVLAYCRHHDLFRPGTVVVVAVSGGADSMCLLYCLHALSPLLGIRLHVAHVNHLLRADESDADAAFVAQAAEQLGLHCTVERIDVRSARGKSRESLEAAARALRYVALRKIAANVGGDCIATGHTRNDQAETVLINLLRGAGIDGLSGMRPRERQIVRPLLDVSRDAVEAYNAELGIDWREDQTNEDQGFRRNAIRHEIMPRLERYNPRVQEALARSATIIGHDADYMLKEAGQALAHMRTLAAPGSLELDRAALRLLPIGLRFHVLRLAIEELLGTRDGFSAQHFEAIDALALARHAGRCDHLPHGLRAEASGNRFLLLFTPEASATAPPLVELPVPGEAPFGDWTIKAEIAPQEFPGIPPRGRPSRSALTVLVGRTEVGNPLYVRSRQPGDRVEPLGSIGSRKLQDLFVDAKVLRSDRDRIPILAGPSGIVWVVGYAQDVHSLPREGATDRILISAERPAIPGTTTDRNGW